jgi:hypothetical protein
VEARAQVDRAVATTGDVITYTVTVDYDPSYEVDVPEPGADIAGFRILDVGREPDRSADGRVVETRWYELRADLVGSYVLPPVTVSYRPKTGQDDAGARPEDAGTVQTSAIFVEVESVLAAAEAEGEDVGDIRDLKPLQPPPSHFPWVWIGAGAAVLLLAGAAVWLLRRRRRAQAPPVPPHEVAFEALRALKGTDFSDPEAVRRFHFRISEVLRAYVEGRFGLNATDLTTEEILPRLGEVQGLPAAEAESLCRFLLATDRVKFADHRPTAEEVQQTWERALSFVEATRPREEPEGEAPPGPATAEGDRPREAA